MIPITITVIPAISIVPIHTIHTRSIPTIVICPSTAHIFIRTTRITPIIHTSRICRTTPIIIVTITMITTAITIIFTTIIMLTMRQLYTLLQSFLR